MDGIILAVSDPGPELGSDRYSLENDNVEVRWKQLGQDIQDKNGFGYSVALS